MCSRKSSFVKAVDCCRLLCALALLLKLLNLLLLKLLIVVGYYVLRELLFC